MAMAERTAVDPLTLAEAARIMREAVRDKSYELLPLGQDVARYLRAKRKELTDSSYIGYETCLDKLSRAFPHLDLADLELPAGGDLVEEWMDDRWGDAAPGTYNVNHSILSDFFKWQVKKGRMRSNPMTLVGRARKRDVYRTVFTGDQYRAILSSAADLRDRLALRLLLDYGLRKGALRAVQFKHFDYGRKRLTIFTKGGKVRDLPIPDPRFWTDLERHILEVQAEPNHFLLCVIKQVPYGPPDELGHRQVRAHRMPDRAMANTTADRWWYFRLADAGLQPRGVQGSNRRMNMHVARHTAGQRILDASGDLKLVQKQLGHKSIQTTGDIYVDYDIDQHAARLAAALAHHWEDDE